MSTLAPVAAPAATDRRPFTLRLEQLGRSDVALAGGKGANLGELLRTGQPVPPGFVVTTAAYAMVAGTAPSGPAEGVAARILAAAVPDAVADAVRQAAELLGGAVAVRSSATAEDLPGAAFAGQQDTLLNVAGPEAVLDAVRRCWASLWTARAVDYRERRGVDPASVRMAVVVQRMVDADFAGVLLTADPVTGDRRRTVIEANPGLGEAVVGGLVTPDRFVLDRHGRVRERRRGRRETAVRTAATGGVRQEAAGDEDLPDAALTELARRGRDIAAHFGAPQDIEWAVAGGACWILQARPMTALPPEPVRVRGPARLSTTMLAELLPVRPYPIDMSTWTTRGHGRILERMAAEIVGIRVDMRQILPEVDGVVDRIEPPRARVTRRALSTPARVRRAAARFVVEEWTADPRFTAFERTMAELTALEPAELPWDSLLAVPERCLRALDGLIDVRVDFLPDAGLRFVRLAALLAVGRRLRMLGDLLVGAPTRTADAARALHRLAAVAREDPVTRAAFETPSEDLVADLDEEPAFGVLRERIAAYQAEFGSREITSPFLVTVPTWGEDPAVLLGALSALMHRPAPAGDVAARADRLAQQVLAGVRPARLRVRLARAIPAARAAVAFREDTHFHAMRPVPVLRRALLQMGSRLTAAGVLDDQEDLFSLRLEELTGLPEPHRIPPDLRDDLRARAAARRARRALLAGAPLLSPLTLRPRPDRSTALVTGASASGGRATGRVRVLRDARDFGALRPGEVLVAPWTNPSWTPLFGVAGAVVVDTGGPASHAAIVAREYGIPAVVGTGNGTSVLTDGMRVTVDGTAGRVLGAS